MNEVKISGRVSYLKIKRTQSGKLIATFTLGKRQSSANSKAAFMNLTVKKWADQDDELRLLSDGAYLDIHGYLSQDFYTAKDGQEMRPIVLMAKEITPSEFKKNVENNVREIKNNVAKFEDNELAFDDIPF